MLKIPQFLLYTGMVTILIACADDGPPPQPPAAIATPTRIVTIESHQVSQGTATPTVTAIPPAATPTPTPKPKLEDVLLADARHIQGMEDAPVTLIEFSDFK